jgi:hypothetical protein
MPFLNFEPDRSRQEQKAAREAAEEKAKHASEIEAQTPRSQSPSRQGRPKEREELPIVSRPALPKQPQRSGSTKRGGEQVPEKPDSKQQTISGSRASKQDTIRFLDHRRKCTLLIQEYLNHERGHLHLSRTLDQFYYSSIDTTHRPKTQVVYDFSKKYEKLRTYMPSTEARREHHHSPHFCQSDSKQAGKVTEASKGDRNPTQQYHPKYPNRSTTGLPAQEPHTKKANASQESPVSNQVPKQALDPLYYLTKPKPPIDSENPKKFTVDQLWLWVLDESTFSDRVLFISVYQSYI